MSVPNTASHGTARKLAARERQRWASGMIYNPQINDIGYVKAAKWAMVILAILFTTMMSYLHHQEKRIGVRASENTAQSEHAQSR